MIAQKVNAADVRIAPAVLVALCIGAGAVGANPLAPAPASSGDLSGRKRRLWHRECQHDDDEPDDYERACEQSDRA
jgi:hypothetical protein